MKNKRLYNYLVNTYGLSKKKVLEHMEERFVDLEEVLKKQIIKEAKEKLDSYYIRNFMKNTIAQILKNGFNTGDWRATNTSLETYVKEIVRNLIKEEVSKQLNKEYKISLSFQKENLDEK